MTNQDLLNLIAAHPDIQALYDAGDDVGVAAALNDQTKATVSKLGPVSIPAIFGLLSESSLAKLASFPDQADLRNIINSGDRLGLQHFAQLCAARPNPSDASSVGYITQAEAGTVIQYLTVPGSFPGSLAEAAFGVGTTIFAGQVLNTRPVTPPPAPVIVTSVEVTAPASVRVGETAQATAVALDAQGNAIAGKTVSAWQGHDLDVLAVFASGAVVGRKAGTAVVLATIDGVVGQASVTVTE